MAYEFRGSPNNNNNNNNNNISEERADGLTLWLVDGDGSWCALDCVRCEKTWRSSFVEIGNEVHVRDDGLGEVEWPADDTNGVELVAVGGFGGFNGFDGVDSTVDGLVASMALVASNGGVEWWRRWLRWRRRYCRMVVSNGGVEWWRRMVASMASMGGIDDGDWGLRHRGH